jgi:outer membrane protein assembly factor BamB
VTPPISLARSVALAAGTTLLIAAAVPAQTQPPEGPVPATIPARTAELSVLWRTELGKPILAAPVVSGQSVFVADQAGRLTSLDLTTGRRQWQTDLGSAISASPLVADGVVYVGDEQGKFHAVQTSTGKDRVILTAGDKIVGQAALHAGVIYVGSYDRNLYAIDVASGQNLWSFETQAQVNAGPVIAGESVLVAGCDAKVRALDAKTGQEQWSVDAGGPVAASPFVFDGRVFAATLKGDRIAIDPIAGRLLWQSREMPETDGDASFSASPVLSPISRDCIMFTAQSGQAFHHDAATGKGRTTTQIRGRIAATPVLWKGLVCIVTEEGRVYASSTSNGQWVLRFTAGAGIKAPPAAAGERLLVGDEDGTLWCLADPADKPRKDPK